MQGALRSLHSQSRSSMYKRVCAFFCILVCLYTFSNSALSTHQPPSQSIISKIHFFVVDAFSATVSYIRSLFVCVDASNSSNEPLCEKQECGSIDTIVFAEDTSCSVLNYDSQTFDDELESQEYNDEDDDDFIAQGKPVTNGITETDLVQLLEQLQQALDEPDEGETDQNQADAQQVYPDQETLKQLITDLEYAPVTCMQEDDIN